METDVPGSVAHASILKRMSEAPFTSFVPAIVTERLARSGRDVAGPDGWRTAGVALVIDITGFTALTERLAKRGPGGAETLASMLDKSFGDVIERIYARGRGTSVEFPGDGDHRGVDPGRRRPVRLRSRRRPRAPSRAERRLLEARPPGRGGLRSRPGWGRHRRHVGRDRRRGRRRMAWDVGGPPMVARSGAAGPCPARRC